MFLIGKKNIYTYMHTIVGTIKLRYFLILKCTNIAKNTYFYAKFILGKVFVHESRYNNLSFFFLLKIISIWFKISINNTQLYINNYNVLLGSSRKILSHSISRSLSRDFDSWELSIFLKNIVKSLLLFARARARPRLSRENLS